MSIECKSDFNQSQMKQLFVSNGMSHLCKIIIAGLVLFFLIPFTVLHAQQQDTIPAEAFELPPIDSFQIDTSLIVKEKKKYPIPKKAAFLSLALPGAGQIYNKRWWKLPLVYGALGGVIYAIDYNTGLYNRFRVALNSERAGEEHEFTGFAIGTEQALLNKRNEFDKNRQLAYVGLVAVYALTAVEAFVDAHLKNFDIDEDLGFKIEPQFETVPLLGQPLMGMGLSIPIAPKKPTPQPKAFFTAK